MTAAQIREMTRSEDLEIQPEVDGQGVCPVVQASHPSGHFLHVYIMS